MTSRVAGAAAAIVVALLAAACGADGMPTSSRPPFQGRVANNVTALPLLPGTADVTMSGCGPLAVSGEGTGSGTASLPAVTAVAHSRVLTTITRAIAAVGLTNFLNSAKSITIFAPDDAAFAALGRGNLTTLLASRHDLAKVLRYHVVSGRQTRADLASGKHLTTLLGTLIIPAKSHGKYRVNNAQVVCGDIQTANATIYIVNKVLVPIP